MYPISGREAGYTVKYETGGIEALRDRRGWTKPLDEMFELEKLRTEDRILQAEKEHAEMEAALLKIRRDREETGLSLVRYIQIYQAIKGYPIGPLCKLRHVSRAVYYKWLRSLGL